jgi:Ca2+-binding RTX toxin-like protein
MRRTSPFARALVIGTTTVAFTVALVATSADATSPVDARRPACTITGTNGDDVLRGTDGADVICARRGDDTVHGRGGDDILRLGPGSDSFDGDAGNDRVYAGPGVDLGAGDRGDDRIFLQGGADNITYGLHGSDLLVGGRGNDQCLHVWGDGDGDRVVGGPGTDRFNADPGDVIRSAEIGPTNCEGV